MVYEEDTETLNIKKRFVHRVLLAEISLISLALALNSVIPYPIGVLLALSQLCLGNYLLINDLEKLSEIYHIKLERRRILSERRSD